MHILVTGAAGMIGRKLTERLAKDGALHGRAIEKLTLADVFTAHPPPGIAADVEIVTRDLASPVVAEALVAGRPDVIFHTAGIVSAEAELDFDKGHHSNLDGVGLRLPAICVRPGKPNKAASGFFSSIIREPLAGHEAVLPVDEKILHTHASPRAAVGFLIHAAGLAPERLGARINLTMPGVSCTVAEQIAALRRIAGDKVAARIRREPDPLVIRIVDGWPHRFDAARARGLGFMAERTFEEIIRIHIEDE